MIIGIIITFSGVYLSRVATIAAHTREIDATLQVKALPSARVPATAGQRCRAPTPSLRSIALQIDGQASPSLAALGSSLG